MSAPKTICAAARALCLPAMIAAALSGCLGSSLPDCGDQETLEVLQQLLEETVEESVYGREMQELVHRSIRRIQQIAHDKQNERYTCKAVVEFTDKKTGKTFESDIAYTVYAVQDQDANFEVLVEGLQEAVFAATVAIQMGGFK